jgi:hypothetical protein
MIRNEFDPRYLNFDLNGSIHCSNDVLDYYKRYQYLMHKLYDYITAKLADVIPTSVEGLAPRNTVIIIIISGVKFHSTFRILINCHQQTIEISLLIFLNVLGLIHNLCEDISGVLF